MFLVQYNTGNYGIETPETIEILLKKPGTKRNIIDEIKYFFATDSAIATTPTVPVYGIDQKNLKSVYLPPQYIMPQGSGWGGTFMNHYHNPTAERVNDIITYYSNLVKAAISGIGPVNAFTIAGVAIAALARGYFILKFEFFPNIDCVGENEVGKTPANKHLSNVCGLPEEDVVESLQSCKSEATFNQISSAGMFPLTIDECGRSPEVLKEIIPEIIQSCTTNNVVRKRSKQDGNKRDAPPYLRSTNLISNHPIVEIADPETGSRFIHLHKWPSGLPNNVDEWHAAKDAFENCESNILGWIAYHITELDLPGLFTQSVAKAKEYAIAHNINPHDRSNKKAVAVFFGMLLLRQYFKMEIPEETFVAIYENCIEGNSAALKNSTGNIFQALHTMNSRYQAWEECKNELEYPPDEDHPPDPASLKERMARLISEGMVRTAADFKYTQDGVKKVYSEDCYVLLPSDVFNLRKESHVTTLIFSTSTELKHILNGAGIQTISASIHIPWLNETKWCLCIPVPKSDPEEKNECT